MTFSKLIGSTFLALIVFTPFVSRASLFSDMGDWFTSLSDQVASVGMFFTSFPTTGDSTKMDVKVKYSDGPVSVADGTNVSVSWRPQKIDGLLTYKDCKLIYPGQTGPVTKKTIGFGAIHIKVYPSLYDAPYVQVSCNYKGETISDFVKLAAVTATTHTSTQTEHTSNSSASGGGTAGAGAHVGGGIHTGSGSFGGSYNYVPTGTSGSGIYTMPLPGTGTLGDPAVDAQAREFQKSQQQ